MNKLSISDIKARQIIDSRGNPTIEADVILENGSLGRAAVPSGASTGQKEALELRDQDKTKFLGKSVNFAIENIHNQIKPALMGQNCQDQAKIDQIMIELDATENKSNLGANAMLGVSMATLRACAVANHQPLYEQFGQEYSLPVPMMNVINGGSHADNNLDIQEFMIIPHGFETFSQSLQAGCEIFHHLKTLLKQKNLSTNVGDEGGFAPALQSNHQALDLLMMAIETAGYKPHTEISLALDVASSEFYTQDRYRSNKGTDLNYSSQELIEMYAQMVEKYPIVSIEDGLDENDWAGWQSLTQKLSDQLQLVGDDLFVTHPKILQKGIASNVANAILIKVNQIGTVSETLQTIALAKSANYNNIISHRSGETEDTFIADLCVGTNAGQIKTGSLSRSDRMAKYNQLLRIEEQLNGNAFFSGKTLFKS